MNTTEPAPLGSSAPTSQPTCFESENCFSIVLGSIALAIALHVFFAKKTSRLKRVKNPPMRLSREEALKKLRKESFLKRAGRDYGYRDSPIGFIDDWRKEEFPSLIAPSSEAEDQEVIPNMESSEVYLDYAGAALPSRSLLNAIHKDAISSSSISILANPHSSGPAAARTLRLIEEAKKLVLDRFQGQPGRFATVPPNRSPNQSETDTTASPSNDLFHPGYSIVFTSGTTDALRIVAEHFPWSNGTNASSKSLLLYSHNAHTSVVGMRGAVKAKGGNFLCKSLKDIMQLENATVNLDEALTQWVQQATGADGANGREGTEGQQTSHNLLVVPAECNFGGKRVDARPLLNRFRRLHEEHPKRRWSTMLDLAKAASTGPVNLKELDPDFACISFYKMFGAPTGLGALFVRCTAANLLVNPPTYSHTTGKSIRRYFGGGSVDVVLSGADFAVGRNLGASSSLASQNISSSVLASLTHGTMHFRGIVALKHGFQELERLGGMRQIQKHTQSLARELVSRLISLRHGNQHPAVVLYGAWGQKEVQPPGPVVAFNILRSDGSVVGYNEVAKLAALNEPPLQVRTGCFCNPGACQEALQLTDDDLIENFTSSGHVCGDDIDIVNGKPVGAIRASFGKDSVWEDMDALVLFIEDHFVASVAPRDRNVPVASDGPIKAVIREIYIYPIKSCAAQAVARWRICSPSGRLQFDREFALVDSFGTALRLQRYPKMGSVRPEIDLDQRTLKVSAPGMEALVLKLDADGENDVMTAVVSVCGNKCCGKVWGGVSVSDWFSSFLGVQCWLARYNNRGQYSRAPPGGIAPSLGDTKRAFSNEKPILLISKHAVDTLNEVLTRQEQPQVSTKHFRPNLVVDCRDRHGNMTFYHPEDSWKSVQVAGSDTEFLVAGLCARCAMVDVDPTTGTKGKTLRALAEYRRDNSDINFGIFLQLGGGDTEAAQLGNGSEFLCR